MKILKNIEVDWRDRRLIKELYMNQTARVRIDNVLSEHYNYTTIHIIWWSNDKEDCWWRKLKLQFFYSDSYIDN